MVQKRNNMDSEIILSLLNGGLHLRDIARRLGGSHSTIMRKLNVLVNENVLDYKFEGKNKVFFVKKNLQAKNYVFNAERYKLMKLVNEYPEIGVIIDDVLKKSGERLIVLFGSYAKFEARGGSDIDLYIETSDKKTKGRIESINSGINVKIGNFDMKSPLIKEIIKNHIILRGTEEFYEKTGFFG
jgi:predicted nucleotidyltransferase